jgi:hypothetical protein
MWKNCTANINFIIYGIARIENEFGNLLHNKLSNLEEGIQDAVPDNYESRHHVRNQVKLNYYIQRSILY